MSDFAIQFLEGVIPAVTAPVDVNAPPLMGIDIFGNAFIIPAIAPMQTAGIGRFEAVAQGDTLAACQATANLTDIDTARFTRASSADNTTALVGAHVLEYVGGVGGPNEVKVRAVKSFSGTAAQFDSSAISGISDLAKTVAFVTYSGSLGSGQLTSHTATAQVLNIGGNNVVRIDKVNATNTLNVVAYIVEFVGSNWSVQKKLHTFSASDTNEDEAISAVTVAKTFTYSTFKASQNAPRDMQFYVYLTSTTNLRHRLRGSVSGSPVSHTVIISNPQLNVTVIGANPDGTTDLAAGGSLPETRNITISAVPNKDQCLVLGYLGSDQSGVTQRQGGFTMMDLTTTTNLRLRRSVNDGATEYKIQIIDFSLVNGGVIETVSPITDGQPFVITGVFAGTPVVTINGVTQTVDTFDGDSIECTAVLGDNRYDTNYSLKVDNSSIILTAPSLVEFLPPAGKNFTTLSPPLVPAANRLTTSGDLTGTEQIEYSLVIGGGITDVLVYSDGAFSVAAGISQFSFRAHDGVSWGTMAVQLVSAPVPPKTKALSCPVQTEF